MFFKRRGGTRILFPLCLRFRQPTSGSNASSLGTFDSGAEISIASFESITAMGLPIVTLASPIPLLFANKSKSQTQHAVDLGPLGLIYLVHEAADALLSFTTLVNNGFSILMSKDGVKILDKDGCTVYDRLRQPSEARWSLDLFAAAKACAECAQCIPCSAGPLPAPRRRDRPPR